VEDDGTVLIAPPTSRPPTGHRHGEVAHRGGRDRRIYMGTVKKVVDFGAFVEILPAPRGSSHLAARHEACAQGDRRVNEGDKIP